jgi:tRNA threonylcarbamoyladenosine biosynthesis protein TsaB
MPHLPQLLANHDRILVLDAASTRVTVGLLRAGQSAIWHQTDDDAGQGIFRGTEAVLQQAGLTLEAIDAFGFCVGPGSMLGTRTIAMILRTWVVIQPRPVYGYQSLAIAARAEWTRRPRAFTVLADARRESWHAQGVTAEGVLLPLRRLGATELPAGELFTPAEFRAWSTRPSGVRELRYDLAAIFAQLDTAEVFFAEAAPDAFQHERPDYKKWSAQPHSAETAPKR